MTVVHRNKKWRLISALGQKRQRQCGPKGGLFPLCPETGHVNASTVLRFASIQRRPLQLVIAAIEALVTDLQRGCIVSAQVSVAAIGYDQIRLMWCFAEWPLTTINEHCPPAV